MPEASYTYAFGRRKSTATALLLWTIIPIAFALAFAQEISARMGVVTGKGTERAHSREE